MLAAEAADCGASAAGPAFVARLVSIVEIGAAGALQQITRRRRLVAQLARGAREQRPREQPVIAPDPWIGGKVGVAHQSANAQTPFGRRLDLVERQAVHIDQMGRRLDLELHQVEQVGAAGDEAAARRPHCRRRGFGRGARAFVGEGLHALLPAFGMPATSEIASMMFE